MPPKRNNCPEDYEKTIKHYQGKLFVELCIFQFTISHILIDATDLMFKILDLNNEIEQKVEITLSKLQSNSKNSCEVKYFLFLVGYRHVIITYNISRLENCRN